ncbi:putative transcriptional regulator [Thauera phenylacetica B4P]|uniref:Putative transcriptional regulator n=1 Tax=Thauera phenylacetica B4P TaxID=1234382 RepID=N6ZW88_9RHOO|nr:helix-turn-helix transcriptional regulator [Thauera phenylacetica]ENO98628.1 putative transcriptional regulator [Thauera phenylacetica B4P]
MNMQFHERLAEERERLGLTQEEMAKAGGVAKRTYCNYENGDREPPSSFLGRLKEVGVDVGYLLLGVRQFDSLGIDASEERLLSLYRSLSAEDKLALEAVALMYSQPDLASVLVEGAKKIEAQLGALKPSNQVINAPVTNVAGRDVKHVTLGKVKQGKNGKIG